MSFSLHALRPMGLVSVGVLSTLGALSLTHLGPVQAQSPGVNLAALLARLNADEAKIALLQGTPVPGPQGPAGPKGDTGAQGPVGPQGPAGAGAIAALTQTGKDVYFTGVNVHIVDGTGSTASASGLGNLTIGYNSLRQDGTDARTGSHNLILGDFNNYSSFGGIVAGISNTISDQYASVSGGYLNKASGQYASVSGGYQNTASGYDASVSGGYQNTASGYIASVSGGAANTASAQYASISGGAANTARYLFASVSGGYQNTASEFASSVSGGHSNTAGISYAWVAGSYHSP